MKRLCFIKMLPFHTMRNSLLRDVQPGIIFTLNIVVIVTINSSSKKRYARTTVMAGGILKDIREIYSSIFDHKPVVHREVEFFVKEFEESRRDREVDRLFKILERVTELKDTEINKCKSLADIHIPKLSAELQVAESIADTLLDKRLKAETDINSQLEKRRQDRTAEWDKFVHDMTNKCIRIDNTFKEKEDEVRELYKKAEERLIEQQESEVAEDCVNSSSVLNPPGENATSSATSTVLNQSVDLNKANSTLES